MRPAALRLAPPVVGFFMLSIFTMPGSPCGPTRRDTTHAAPRIGGGPRPSPCPSPGAAVPLPPFSRPLTRTSVLECAQRPSAGVPPQRPRFEDPMVKSW